MYQTIARHLIKRAGLSRAMLADIQTQLAYLDVWDDVDHLDWTRLRPASRDALQCIALTGGSWLPPPTRDRLLRLMELVIPAT